MRSSGLRRRAVALLVMLCLSSTHVVFAQTESEKAGARAAATEGLKAFNEKKYAEAADLFQRAESLVHAPTHLLYLARSYAALGQLVKAQETYSKITHENIASDAPKAFHDAKTSAQKELTDLEPRIPTVKVTIEGSNKGSKVSIDGVDLPAALVGIATPIDPGEHTLLASAEGMKSEPVKIHSKEGGHDVVTLVLNPAGTTSTGTTGTTGTATTGTGDGTATSDTTTTTTAATPDTGTSSGGSKILPYSLIGVGVVGLAVGTIFYLGGVSKQNDADSLCNLPGGGCPASAQNDVNSLDDEAKSKKTIGFIGWGLGAAAAVTGIVLLVTSPSSSSSSTASAGPSIHPWIGFGSAGVGGAF